MPDLVEMTYAAYECILEEVRARAVADAAGPVARLCGRIRVSHTASDSRGGEAGRGAGGGGQVKSTAAFSVDPDNSEYVVAAGIQARPPPSASPPAACRPTPSRASRARGEGRGMGVVRDVVGTW